MACHHSHHCHPTTTSASYCYCYSTCCAPPPPGPLHSLPSHSHHYSPQPHLYSPYHNPHHDPQTFHYQHQQPPSTHLGKQTGFGNRFFEHQQSENQSLVSSLLRRIDALESSLRRQCAASPASSSSLRDAAARTIQTHYRAFLVRRSRTLRQLRDLASIKSTLNALKGSLSKNSGTDPRALCVKATNLLLHLDSIQCGDPMIRDGKRSTSREIIRFLGFLDGLSPKRNELSRIELKNARSGDKTRVLYSGKKIGTANLGAREERVLLEKITGLIENLQGFSRVSEGEEDGEAFQLANSASNSRNGGVLKKLGGAQAKAKKTVSFAENGIVSGVVISTDDGDEEKELREIEEIGIISKGGEDDEEEMHSGDGEPSRINVREGHFGKNFRAG